MASSATEKDTGWKQFKKTLRKMGDKEVVVGIPGPVDFGAPNSAAIGMVQEFGTDDGHVPARSFIRSTFDANERKYTKLLERVVAQGIKTKRPIDAALFQVGEVARGDVINRIVSQQLDNLPLAASTLAAKFPKSKALINEGTLVGSITAESPVVRKK